MLFSLSTLIIVTLVIFFWISMRYTEKVILDNSINYTSQLIGQVNRDIDTYIHYMENISHLVVNSHDILEYLFDEKDSPKEEEGYLYGRIRTQFQTVVETREDISNIAVISTNGKCFINDGKERINKNIQWENIDWYQKALKGEGSVLTPNHVQNVIQNNYKWVVTLSKSLENPYTGQKEGVFFIDLNYKVIKDLCENNKMGANSYIFIMDERGKMIYHPKQQQIHYGLWNEKIQEILQCKEDFFLTSNGEEGMLYNISISEKTNWRIVGVAYTTELMRYREETQQIYLLTAAILLALTLFIVTLLSGAITKPIKALKDSMKEVEQGNFENMDVEIEERMNFGISLGDMEKKNEIGSLLRSFHVMTIKIRELMEQNIFEQRQKRIHELKALQAQINPHFLYNTLDSIIWMAEGNKNKEVVRMTSSLAKLLRQSISNEQEEIPLEQELQYIKEYLTIQKMRYKDKLEFDIQIEPDLGTTPILKLVLQPIVENAIYHGIKYKDGKGFLGIHAYREGEDVAIEIYDNGIGMDGKRLNDIFSPEGKTKGGGVGILNVQMRLKLNYGDKYGLFFTSTLGEGTLVTIRIPWKEEREEIDESY
ncbi:MAG: histidine kinase [Lachnospiraceae bacterium]|nr:histidine kinase [Lachnospiraceae bacterium]